MGRWEPDAKLRLRSAALDLFAAQGFEQTTAAEIAQTAGLTERTFYRHFADKREVIFGGTEFLLEAGARAVADAPEGATPLGMAAGAVQAAGEYFPEERREYSRRRQVVIDANPALQERELLKMAGFAGALRDALAARGVPEPTATLAAETGRTVFTVAFAQWIADGETRSFATIATEILTALRAVA